MRKCRIIAVLLMIMLMISGCGEKAADNPMDNQGGNPTENQIDRPVDKPAGNPVENAAPDISSDLGDAEETYGEDIQDELYKGYSETASSDLSNVTITCLSGSDGCYTKEGSTITFTNVSADSIYTIAGEFKGNIVIDVGDDYKFELELLGLSISSDNINPILIKSGDKVTLTAKKDYSNYVYDLRAAVDENSETEKAGAIYSEVDLRIGGKGELTVVSENNNGIHSKKDLEVKNVNLTVHCRDNALKGNDSVTLEGATATLISTMGDGIKTSNSDISSKGNQRGAIFVSGGTYNVYAACDGLDAAYDIVVEDTAENATVLNVFTDKYSNYSEEVTVVAEDVFYIRSFSDEWKYSVKYYNSDEDYVWITPEKHSEVSGGRTSYFYYSYPKMQEYSKVQFFIYSGDMEQGQEADYLAMTDYLTVNTEYDTFALASQGNSLSYSWTNYTTQIVESFGGGPGGGRGGHGGFGGGPGGFGGMGGFGEGNTDKGEYSTKGMKAANEIVINSGTVNIKAYDDAIHANNDTTLENGESPKGNVIINGGAITVYSNDDGLHADGTITVNNGTVSVVNSYEGVEGSYVEIIDGSVSVNAKDDGINATTTTGTAVTIAGGDVYIYCSGDGIDSNSRTSYEGIVFSGGNTVTISTSGGNSAIDSEQGYKYEGGQVVAIMPSGGMSQEAVHCKNFSEIGSKRTTTMIAGRYVNVAVNDETVATIQMPSGISGMVIYLGSNGASVSVEETTSAKLDSNGVCWYK